MNPKASTSRYTSLVLLVLTIVLFSATSYLSYATYKTKTYIMAGDRLAAQTTPYAQAGTDATTILILGDSLAYGVGTSAPNKSFAGQIGARYPNSKIVNRALVGEDSGSLAGSLDSLVDSHYTMIFLIVGGNDISHYSVDLERSKKNLAHIYDKLSRHADAVYTYTSSNFAYVAAIPSILKPYYSDRSRVIRDQSLQLAQSYPNITYIDAFDTDPVGYASMQAEDGFHLNDSGVSALMDMTFRN